MRRPTPLLLFCLVLGCHCSDLDPGQAAFGPASASVAPSASAFVAPTPAELRQFCASIFDSLGAGALSKCSATDKQRDGWAALAAQVQYDVDRCSNALEDTRRVDVIASALPGCESRLRAVVVSDDPSIDASAACDPIAQGKQPEGALCIDQLQCAQGLVCVGDAAKTEGMCKKPRADGKCETLFDVLETTTLDRQCAADSFCHPYRHTCAPRGKKGEKCAYDESCAEGLVCVMQLCAEHRAHEGDACRDELDCTRNDYCDAKSGTCAKKKYLGKSCDDDRACFGKCIDEHCLSFCGSG